MAAIELGCPYFVYNPAQTEYCAFNAPGDPSLVGYVTDITGLDDSGVRENAQVVTAGDGGHHGNFYEDRRPWTMAGFILPVLPLLARDQSQELLQGIVGQAMKQDGIMVWTPADGVKRKINFRKQQPVRVTKGQSPVEKLFQILLVSADWRVFSYDQQNVSVFGTGSPLTTPIAQNIGNADAPPKFVITGPWSGNLTITDITTGKKLTLNSVSIAAGASWTIDLAAQYPTVTDNSGNDHYGAVDPLQTDWTIAVAGTISVANGNNQFTIQGAGNTGASGLTVYWNHAWL